MLIKRKTNKNDNKKILKYISLIIIFIVIAIGHSFVGMYHDDYGYASLSYGYVVEGVQGVNFQIKDLLHYLSWHYNYWGGRIICFFIEILLLKLGIRVFMIFQSLVITLILYYIYKIVNYCFKDKTNPIILFLLLGLYMLFPLRIVNNGFYWSSASILYVWPLLPSIMGMYYFILSNNKLTMNQAIGKKYFIIIPLTFFFACFSQEQIGFATIVFVLSYIILYQRINITKYLELNLLAVIPSIIGYALLMFAPGNFTRLESSGYENTTLIIKIIERLKIIRSMIFHDSNIIYFVLLSIALLYLLLSVFKHKNIKELITSEKSIILISVIFSSVASQLMMVMSPSLPERMQIIMWMLTFIIISIFFNSILDKKIARFFIIIIFSLGLINYSYITIGYYENYSIIKDNDQKLKSFSNNIGLAVDDEITLTKLPNSKFGGSMPYEKGTEYITSWIKQYYNISDEVNFNWKSGLELDFNPAITSIYPNPIILKQDDIAIGVKAEKLDTNTVIIVDGEELLTTYSPEFISAIIPNRILKNKDFINVSLKWNLYDVISNEIKVPINK